MNDVDGVDWLRALLQGYSQRVHLSFLFLSGITVPIFSSCNPFFSFCSPFFFVLCISRHTPSYSIEDCGSFPYCRYDVMNCVFNETAARPLIDVEHYCEIMTLTRDWLREVARNF